MPAHGKVAGNVYFVRGVEYKIGQMVCAVASVFVNA